MRGKVPARSHATETSGRVKAHSDHGPHFDRFGDTERFPTAEAGWEWVLGHPCPAEPPAVVDLTEREQTRCE